MPLVPGTGNEWGGKEKGGNLGRISQYEDLTNVPSGACFVLWPIIHAIRWHVRTLDV